MLAFLGGTGPEGKGLAHRLAMAGEEVIIGSRDPARAQATAAELQQAAPNTHISGEANYVAAQRSNIVFITVPFDAQKPLLQSVASVLAGKVVVNVIAPLVFNRGRAHAISVEEGSAAVQSQVLLPDSQVVGAFQNVSAEDLATPDHLMEGDVVVCSDHPEAKEQVMALVTKVPDLRPIDGGRLENARYVEDFTALLVNINRIYKCHSGIKIVGV